MCDVCVCVCVTVRRGNGHLKKPSERIETSPHYVKTKLKTSVFCLDKSLETNYHVRQTNQPKRNFVIICLNTEVPFGIIICLRRIIRLCIKFARDTFFFNFLTREHA